MSSKKQPKSSFVQQMHARLLQYQLQKLKRLELKHSTPRQYFQKQQQAKETLIDLDNEKEEAKLTEDDIFIGRWSNYKLPESIESRLNLNTTAKTKTKNTPSQDIRVVTESAKTKVTPHSQSEKAMPKLKCILQQLTAPLHLPAGYQGLIPNKPINKIKTYLGNKVLMVSNNQDAKQYAHTSRKLLPHNQPSNQNQNIRPRFTHKMKGETISDSQPTKRPPYKERNLIYEKQVLSQLLKASHRPPLQCSPLKNMISHFTISSSHSRRNKSNLLSVNKILS